MTVAECFKEKYEELLKHMNKSDWDNIQYYAKCYNRTIPEHMYYILEITENDIRKNGWDFAYEIERMHKDKLLASNKHRQYHGKVTIYWLTKKGVKKMAHDLGLK